MFAKGNFLYLGFHKKFSLSLPLLCFFLSLSRGETQEFQCMQRRNTTARFVSVAVKAVVILSVEKAAAGAQPFIFAKSSSLLFKSFVTAHHRLRGFVSTTTPGTPTARNNDENNNNFQEECAQKFLQYYCHHQLASTKSSSKAKGKSCNEKTRCFIIDRKWSIETYRSP